MQSISSWGRLSANRHQVITITSHHQAVEAVSTKSGQSGLPFGRGRSYGDVCLNQNGVLWSTQGLDRFISFDAKTGRLHCEAGVLLGDIQRFFSPRGWMLAVTPGTQYVTVGGAIANDVHGKNHFSQGSFGHHIHALTLLRTDQTLIQCSATHESKWFTATIGGLGLTGLILHAVIQLQKTPNLGFQVETIPYQTFEEYFHLTATSLHNWQHTVSWVDGQSKQRLRGLFMRANPVNDPCPHPAKQRVFTMPFTPPLSIVNRLSSYLFNNVYFSVKNKQTSLCIDYQSFFYPLDKLSHWNRLYGPKGFFQHQCLIPSDCSQEALPALLQTAAKHGTSLAVLKTFGQLNSLGMLGFTSSGVTLSLDLPHQGHTTKQCLARLDHIVRDHGGRIYLAKDACMNKDIYTVGYSRTHEFSRYRDPGISSDLSRRLMGY